MGAPTKQQKKVKTLYNKVIWLGGLFFIFASWFVFAKPYFLSHLVPYPTRQLVTTFSPWNAYDKYSGPVKNNAMPDIVTQIYPWKHFVISELKAGKLPLWNPYTFSGNPSLANFQTAVFSPFNLLYFVLPFIDAWSLIVLLQPLLAGLFMYALMREFKVSKIGSTLSSISYMFCGFVVVWMAYGTLAMAISFLPLVLFGIERYFSTKKIVFLMLTVTGSAFSLLSGHFQTSLYLLIVTFSFITYKYVLTHNLRATFSSILALTIGILLALPQLIPTIIFYGESFRSANSIVDGGIPLYYLVTAFAPDFFGNPVTRNDWVGFYAERASFIGIIPLLLSGFSFFAIKKRNVTFFILLSFISLILSLDTPLQALLAHSGIPVLSSSNPTRIIVLWSFATAVLAGFGIDILSDLFTKRVLRRISYILFTFGLLIASVWISLIIFHLLPNDKAVIAIHNLLLPSFLFGVVVISLVTSFFISRYKTLPLLVLLFLLLSFFDSYRFAHKWVPFDTTALLYPDVPIIHAMEKLKGDGRVFGAIGTEVQTYYGIPSIEGYDPLYIKRYGEFIKAASTGHYTLPDRSFVSVDRQAPFVDKVLDFLSVTLIFHPKSFTFANWAYPVWGKPDRYKIVYEDEKFQLYKNKKALPLARLYYDVETISDSKKLLARFYEKNFPMEQTVLLEEPPKQWFQNHPVASGSARIVSLSPGEITLEVTSSDPGILFLADPYYPNWEASVNGKNTHIYRADYAFQAVEIPRGKSEVVFKFTYF